MPRESHAWAVAREALAPFGVLHRVENPIVIGFPDALYCLFGVSGLIESKATVGTLKLEQVLWAEEWSAAGGLVFTLLRADGIWFLYDATGTRQLYDKVAEPVPLVRAAGTFPLKEMLRHLAPVNRRRALFGRKAT